MFPPGLVVPAHLLADLLLDKNRGPKQTGDFSVDPTVFVALMLAGFLIGTIGHVYKSRTMVAVGIALIFAVTVAIPVYFGVFK